MPGQPRPTLAQAELANKTTSSQLSAQKRKAVKHTVPSTVIPQFRNTIAAAVAQGRSIPQTAKEYQCCSVVVTEIYIRAELKRVYSELENLRDELRGGRKAA